jgi:hypothetical protein
LVLILVNQIKSKIGSDLQKWNQFCLLRKWDPELGSWFFLGVQLELELKYTSLKGKKKLELLVNQILLINCWFHSELVSMRLECGLIFRIRILLKNQTQNQILDSIYMQNENQDSSNLILKNWNWGFFIKLKNQPTLGQTSNSLNFKLLRIYFILPWGV